MPVRPAPAGHTVWSRCQAEPPIAHLLHQGEFSLHLFDFFELVFEDGCGKLISSATWGIKADRKQFCLQTKRCHRGCKQMCDLFTYFFLKSNTRQRKIVFCLCLSRHLRIEFDYIRGARLPLSFQKDLWQRDVWVGFGRLPYAPQNPDTPTSCLSVSLSMDPIKDL